MEKTKDTPRDSERTRLSTTIQDIRTGAFQSRSVGTSRGAISRLCPALSCLTPRVVQWWLFQPHLQTRCQRFPWPGLVWCPRLYASTDSTPGPTSLASASAFRAALPFVYGVNARSTSFAFASAFTAAFMVCACERQINFPRMRVGAHSPPSFMHANIRGVDSSRVHISPPCALVCACQGVDFSRRSRMRRCSQLPRAASAPPVPSFVHTNTGGVNPSHVRIGTHSLPPDTQKTGLDRSRLVFWWSF